jgi:hypothetical protein
MLAAPPEDASGRSTASPLIMTPRGLGVRDVRE